MKTLFVRKKGEEEKEPREKRINHTQAEKELNERKRNKSGGYVNFPPLLR